jgi:signal peptidase I
MDSKHGKKSVNVKGKEQSMKQRKEKSPFREYAESIILAVILALLMRQFVVQAFKIPSGSMEQTLLIGDHILVNKFLYYFGKPKRFDVIVFQYPWEEDRDFIKRVIGLPGDVVHIRNRQVYVNGQPLEEPYAQYTAAHSRAEDFGPIVVPKKGDVVEIREQQLYLNGQPVAIPNGRFYPRDGGMAMTGFEVFYRGLSGFSEGATLDQPVGPFTVQHDYYLMLGDNRDNSKDSRYWGFVEDSSDRCFLGLLSCPHIKGKAFFVYWSWNRYGSLIEHIRWDRLGKLLGLDPPGRLLAREKAP